LHPDSTAAHCLLGGVYSQSGLTDDPVDSYLQAAKLAGASDAMIESLRKAYQAGGMRRYCKRRAQLGSESMLDISNQRN